MSEQAAAVDDDHTEEGRGSPRSGTRTRRGGGIAGRGRRVLIGALTLVGVLLIVVAGLWFWRPWAPDVVVAEPALSGRWVTEGALTAHWYPAAGASASAPGPGVLVVGGSEGGLSMAVVQQATALQAEGFSVLALAYFGAPGQPDALVDVPLETFDAGLDWLSSRDEVVPGRVGMMGGSKGAEAALLVAAGRDDVAAVVAMMPSDVVWQGLDLQRPWTMATDPGSSWSRGGAPLPYLPFGEAGAGSSMRSVYESALEDVDQRPETRLPLTDGTAGVLLTCGGADVVWPSCPMARELVYRAADDAQDVTLLEYPDAGHAAQGPPRPVPAKLAEQLGGTVAANEEALADSWPRVVDHLRQHLR